jgi:hypothetical protein
MKFLVISTLLSQPFIDVLPFGREIKLLIYKNQQEIFELPIMKRVNVFAKHVNENVIFTEPEG